MGYCIVEGNHLDVMKMTQQYAPYVGFEVHAAASIDDVGDLLKHCHNCQTGRAPTSACFIIGPWIDYGNVTFNSLTY